jgi:hypothetical protein
VKKNSFGLLELEMADLERFWKKTPLGPLGVNKTLNPNLDKGVLQPTIFLVKFIIIVSHGKFPSTTIHHPQYLKCLV